ncbi:hypothetical protein GCM10009741_09870 [Kribbella lupini]|uniref:Uncharacterized protein n=1 Tax=Kribbella lupini TaxID=291602 RepID=A0ABP4L407_9ACTN
MQVQDLLPSSRSVGLEEADAVSRKAVDQQSGGLLEDGPNRSDGLPCLFGGQVDDVSTWHDQRVTAAQRTDVEERDRGIVLVHHPRRKPPRNNPAEGAVDLRLTRVTELQTAGATRTIRPEAIGATSITRPEATHATRHLRPGATSTTGALRPGTTRAIPTLRPGTTRAIRITRPEATGTARMPRPEAAGATRITRPEPIAFAHLFSRKRSSPSLEPARGC